MRLRPQPGERRAMIEVQDRSAERIQELEQHLQNLQLQLLQAQKMSSVGVLAASITHEFNNILTTVINYAKMGLRHPDEATRTKALDRILTASQRAAKITTGKIGRASCRERV